MNNFNIIFPMAGESKRFDYQFKPFLKISDVTFIELAYKYFCKYEKNINKIYFVVTQEQEDNYHIKNQLSELFDNFDMIIIPEKTSGPFMTIHLALQFSQIDINKPSFICDCDHSIDISPMIDYIKNYHNFELLIPYWDIKKYNENYKDWGIIYEDNDKNIINFSEKEIIEGCTNFFGIIGCYYFKKLSYFNHPDYINISDGLFNHRMNIKSVEIKNAEFFGDKDRLNKVLINRKKTCTVFCDIDGTIIEHEKYPDNITLNVFHSSIKKLHDWKDKKYKIILTTARSKKDKLYQLLTKYNIPFDELICNLPSGKRVIINDYKEDLINMSESYNVRRNSGIDNINIESEEIKIVKKLKGSSYSNTVLIEKNNQLIVRKYIIKQNDNIRHYHKLKRQYYDLQKLNCYSENICPKIYNEVDLDYIYYIDIEYFKNYNHLNFNDNKKLYTLLDRLNKDIYITKKINNDKNWINNLFKKVKIDEYILLHPSIQELLLIDEIIINDKKYKGIKKCFEEINFENYNPKYLSVIHGDLTFENIMIHSDNIKLIDPDGSDFLDAIELDFGKLLQSYLSNYETWSNSSYSDKLIKNIDLSKKILNTYEFKNNIDPYFYRIWNIILNNNDINFTIKKGIFYMCIHLLRMIPYRYKSDLNSTIYCIKECIVWLNSII
jgi:hypothetical protein